MPQPSPASVRLCHQPVRHGDHHLLHFETEDSSDLPAFCFSKLAFPVSPRLTGQWRLKGQSRALMRVEEEDSVHIFIPLIREGEAKTAAAPGEGLIAPAGATTVGIAAPPAKVGRGRVFLGC